jgi:hypothetical protein
VANRLFTSFSVLAKASLAAALVGSVWVQPVWASTNLSGNPFFPLVLNSKWTYDYSSTTSSFTDTQTVAGSSSAASSTQVKIDSTDSVLPGKVSSLTYTIGKGGTVEVQGSSGSGSSTSSFSSTYWIPTESQIESCTACKFSGPFSASFSGHSMTGTLTEVATALGSRTVTVPAGTFSTKEMKLVLGMNTTGTMPITMNLTFHLYLAKNVGMVENAGGTIAMNILGHSITTDLGTDKLASYKS